MTFSNSYVHDIFLWIWINMYRMYTKFLDSMTFWLLFNIKIGHMKHFKSNFKKPTNNSNFLRWKLPRRDNVYSQNWNSGVQGPFRLERSRRLTEFKKSFIHGSKPNKIHWCRKLRQYFFTVNYDQMWNNGYVISTRRSAIQLNKKLSPYLFKLV